MASKTISLKEDTYDSLDRAKGEGESFSDVIDRLLETSEEHPLYDLVGVLEDEEVEELRSRSKTFRDQVDEQLGQES